MCYCYYLLAQLLAVAPSPIGRVTWHAGLFLIIILVPLILSLGLCLCLGMGMGMGECPFVGHATHTLAFCPVANQLAVLFDLTLGSGNASGFLGLVCRLGDVGHGQAFLQARELRCQSSYNALATGATHSIAEHVRSQAQLVHALLGLVEDEELDKVTSLGVKSHLVVSYVRSVHEARL